MTFWKKPPTSTIIPHISLPAWCCTNVAAFLAYAPLPVMGAVHNHSPEAAGRRSARSVFKEPTRMFRVVTNDSPTRQQDAPSRSGECLVGRVALHWKWLHRVQPAEDISPTAPERLFQAAWKIQSCRSGFINSENAELSCLKTLQWNLTEVSMTAGTPQMVWKATATQTPLIFRRGLRRCTSDQVHL